MKNKETLEELKKWKEEALIAHEINQKVIEKLMDEKKRIYSEEEVYFILCEHTAELFKGSKLTLTKWFEKFKKK